MENNYTSATSPEGTIGLRELFSRCLYGWYWFILSVALCLVLGVLYILRTPNVYETSSEVQVKTSSRNSSFTNDIADFNSMGIFGVKSSATTEVRAFQSPDVVNEAVRRLGLNMNYSTKGPFHRNVLYGVNRPVEAEFPDVPENTSAAFTLSEVDGGISLEKFRLKGKKIESEAVSGQYGDTLSTPVGRIIIEKTASYSAEAMEKPILVSKGSVQAVAEGYQRRLNVSLYEKNTDVISLSIKDISPERARDFLNGVIAVYNEKWVEDKNQIANSTSVFINDRLRVIESELAVVDSDISAFKSENMIPDVETAATMYMQQSTVLSKEIQEVGNQLYMARYIKDYIADEKNKYQILPSNLGLGSKTVDTGIEEYNRSVIQRNTLVANSGENNILVKELDQTLASMRDAIASSIDNEILALDVRYKRLEATAKQNTEHIAKAPNQAQQLLSVERQQTVKQALYLYLLQKREENELSQAFTAYNTRIIKQPVSGNLPVSPKKLQILLMALVLGLLIPVGALYLQMALDNKVRSRRDLKNISVPLVGEIPSTDKGSKFRKKKRVSPWGANSVIVKQGSRNAVNEAFRVLRTNLEFVLQDPEKNVLGVTSFNVGSGKSFISVNLAVCLALKGKRVIIVDGDLRHGTASRLVHSPKKGLSDYLAGRIDSVGEVIVPAEGIEGVSVLPVGTIPPNPAELISSERFSRMISALKKEYDYVLVDCPPIEIVTDAKIINASVDRTLFVLRAGLLDKSMLPELENLYETGAYRNICCVLNGVATGGSYYGHYGYGYGYGYGYKSYYNNDKEA